MAPTGLWDARSRGLLRHNVPIDVIVFVGDRGIEAAQEVVGGWWRGVARRTGSVLVAITGYGRSRPKSYVTGVVSFGRRNGELDNLMPDVELQCQMRASEAAGNNLQGSLFSAFELKLGLFPPPNAYHHLRPRAPRFSSYGVGVSIGLVCSLMPIYEARPALIRCSRGMRLRSQ